VIAGRPVWLKLDALQPSGSFKLRGVGRACETHVARGARRFVSSSGGNAGLAVAYAGRLLDVLPETKPYGERQAGFVDPGGNTWWVSTYLCHESP
jgi:hypothetical protein